jgi:hypothetical protein
VGRVKRVLVIKFESSIPFSSSSVIAGVSNMLFVSFHNVDGTAILHQVHRSKVQPTPAVMNVLRHGYDSVLRSRRIRNHKNSGNSINDQGAKYLSKRFAQMTALNTLNLNFK